MRHVTADKGAIESIIRRASEFGRGTRVGVGVGMGDAVGVGVGVWVGIGGGVGEGVSVGVGDPVGVGVSVGVGMSAKFDGVGVAGCRAVRASTGASSINITGAPPMAQSGVPCAHLAPGRSMK